MQGRTYKLEELARLAGTSPRTVRYYVQRGLLPAPTFRGKDTAYEHDHLVRLRAIRKLQEAYLPLDAVAAELEGRSIDEIARLAGGQIAPKPSPPSLAASRVPPPEARPYRRIALAPGVELDVADDAPASSRELVERIVALVAEQGGVTR